MVSAAEDEVQDTASLGARGEVQDTGTMWRLVWTASVEQVTLDLLEDAADRDWTEEGGRMMNMSFRMLKRSRSGLVSDIGWG